MPNELSPEQLEELKSRHIRSFSMRRGHISHAQEKAFEEVFPLYEVPYAEAPLNFEEVFGRKAPVVFEIGCGMGETTAAIAQAHPEVNFLGCEVFVAGVGALSKRIKEMELKNVRIIRHDAVDVIEHMIPPESSISISRIPGAKPAIISAASSPSLSLGNSARESVRAAIFTAPQTGRTMPSRCWTCCPTSLRSRTGRERATARSRGIRSVSAPAPSSRPGEKTSVTESGISFISSDKTTAHEKAGF
jgi:hypothetical protein